METSRNDLRSGRREVSQGRFNIEWRDSGREPQVKPNPDYPEGVDLDVTDGAVQACETALPYPAKRIGSYVVECRICGVRVACTTAGRPDDPRSIKVACKSLVQA